MLTEPTPLDPDNPAEVAVVAEAMEHDPVYSHNFDDYGVALYPVHAPPPEQGGDDQAPPVGYVLWWTDYVANDWAEYVPSLPLAFARLAVLIDAAAREAFFTMSVAEYSAAVTDLFARAAT